MFETRKMLIWGKTSPEWSAKYYETVCTGAIDEQTGAMRRIYPVPLRYMDPEKQFKLYHWIEASVEKNPSDARPESYRVRHDSIKVLNEVTTADNWSERSRWILREGNAFSSVEELRAKQQADGTSLGLVKPRQVTRVVMRRLTEADRKAWENHKDRAAQQKDFFINPEASVKELVYIPVVYVVEFTCDDSACTTVHKMSVRDWGLYQLGRKVYAQYDPHVADEKVRAKILKIMDPSEHNSYFFLGNTQAQPTNFMIVGFYYPKRDDQMRLTF